MPLADEAHSESLDLLELRFEQALESRAHLIQRLSEVVCWPSTRIPLHERQLAADVLVGLLRNASVEARLRCAQRMAPLVDAPKTLLRYLARDEITVARPLLEASPALDDADLVATVRSGLRAHWLAMAARRSLSELVSDALIGTCDPVVVEAVLKNPGARVSMAGIDSALAQSRNAESFAALIARRPETSPAQALTMFWWADADSRIQILRRFPVDRSVLINELSDLFAMAAKENWADPETRKAIALIERRQRNRAAAVRSPHGSLDAAVAAAAHGMDRTLASEISYLSGIRPDTGRKIFTDRGGDGIAVLCKATGLKRDALLTLWKGMRRPDQAPDNPRSPLGHVLYVYDLLSNAKAQTVLRYWNWALTTGGKPSDAALLDAGDDSLEFAPARRAAALVFGRRD